MSLSAERIAIANRAICSTFERTSVAWQAVPHWDVGDPAQVKVRSDVVFTLQEVTKAPPPVPGLPTALPGRPPLPLDPALVIDFQMTLAQASAPTADALLAAVIPRAAELAQRFDAAVLPALVEPAFAAAGKQAAAWFPVLTTAAAAVAAGGGAAVPPAGSVAKILAALITGRQILEDSGYRAPSCLIASTAHFLDLAQWVGSNVATEGLLVGANACSLFRASSLTDLVLGGAAAGQDFMIMLGRRQEIAHGEAAGATAGEEAVDIAVSVPPSLEVVGDNAAGTVDLALRIRYALRIKDERAVVVFHTSP